MRANLYQKEDITEEDALVILIWSDNNSIHIYQRLTDAFNSAGNNLNKLRLSKLRQKSDVFPLKYNWTQKSLHVVNNHIYNDLADNNKLPQN